MVFDFYRVDLSSIVVVFLISLFVFLFLNHNDQEKNNLFNILISFSIGVLISIFYSYFTIESDDIMTTNYWE